jgi:hypothetical protein
MSMHEFEDLVEMSVETLAANEQHSQMLLRDLYWNLYEFQGWWDTGFTERRVMELLLQARYYYRFPITEHPEYVHHAAYFDSLGTEFTWIYPNHLEEDENLGYSEGSPPFFYFNVNSRIWRMCVDLGMLSGNDAISANSMNILDVADLVVEDAYHQNNITLIHYWYRLLLPTMMFMNGSKQLTPEFLQGIASLRRIKGRYFQSDAHTLSFDYGMLRPITQSMIDSEPEFIPIYTWWESND